MEILNDDQIVLSKLQVKIKAIEELLMHFKSFIASSTYFEEDDKKLFFVYNDNKIDLTRPMIGPCISSDTNNNVKLKLLKILNDEIHCLQCTHRKYLYTYSNINHKNPVLFSEDVKNELLESDQYWFKILKKENEGSFKRKYDFYI